MNILQWHLSPAVYSLSVQSTASLILLHNPINSLDPRKLILCIIGSGLLLFFLGKAALYHQQITIQYQNKQTTILNQGLSLSLVFKKGCIINSLQKPYRRPFFHKNNFVYLAPTSKRFICTQHSTPENVMLSQDDFET